MRTRIMSKERVTSMKRTIVVVAPVRTSTSQDYKIVRRKEKKGDKDGHDGTMGTRGRWFGAVNFVF